MHLSAPAADIVTLETLERMHTVKTCTMPHAYFGRTDVSLHLLSFSSSAPAEKIDRLLFIDVLQMFHLSKILIRTASGPLAN